MSDKPDLAKLFGAVDVSTFLGIKGCTNLDELAASSVFVGVPCATPYASVGPYAKNGPGSIRQASASWVVNVDRYNFDVDGLTFPNNARPAVDIGDLPWDDKNFESNRTLIKNTIKKIVSKDAVPIVVGGDDSIPIPMIDALSESGNRYTILQIDAHIDWRKDFQGEKFGLSSNMRRASEMPHIQNIVQVGARGIGSAYPEDVQDAIDWGVNFIPAEVVLHEGVQPALNLIPENTKIIICFDIDALDPSIAPNTIGRAPGGLSYRHALDLIKGAARIGSIAAIDFAEILPENDIDGQGGITVSRLIAATMGILARQQG